MIKIIHLLTIFVFFHGFTVAQLDKDSHQYKNKRSVLVGVHVGLWGGTLYALNKTWYDNHQRSGFHLYNDWHEWQQMDKFGHCWSSYQIADHTSKLWQWAGAGQTKAAIIGSVSSLAYLSIIEVLDGHSKKWGFSIPDMLSNSTGALMHLSQALIWKDQRISMKMSYMPNEYGALKYRADDLFGKHPVEKLLKDYNGQTYWASINIRSFIPETRFPRWLNVAVGYGARTMLGGYNNTWSDVNGGWITRNDIPRYRRIYLSADIDLTRIKTNNKTLKTIFSLFNVLKFPAPAIEFNTLGKTRFHPVFY